MRILFCGAVMAAALGLGATGSAKAGVFESDNARGMCIDVSGGTANLQPCRGGPSQDFDYSAGLNDRLRIGGGCLAVTGDGQQLILDRCHKSQRPEQLWRLDNSGELQSGTGLCADVDGGRRGSGTNINAYRCNGQGNQRWSFGGGGGYRDDRGGDYPPPPPSPYPGGGGGGNGEVETMLSPRNAPGSCLEMRRDSNALTISDCSGRSRQRFTYNPQAEQSGFRVKGACVTAPDQPGQPPYLKDCTGGALQHWNFGRDGSIRSMTGYCLHVLHADDRNGTPVIVSDCERGARHQEWDPR